MFSRQTSSCVCRLQMYRVSKHWRSAELFVISCFYSVRHCSLLTKNLAMPLWFKSANWLPHPQENTFATPLLPIIIVWTCNLHLIANFGEIYNYQYKLRQKWVHHGDIWLVKSDIRDSINTASIIGSCVKRLDPISRNATTRRSARYDA